MMFLFFFNDTATTEIYTLSLHDALPIFEKLAVIALISASKTMQLVLARAAPNHDQPAEHVFDERQIEVIEALQARLQGRISKQKNPYPPKSLAWAAWTIARLGGWSGYESERSTGPITM